MAHTSKVETQNTDGRRRQRVESSDEGIGLNCDDTHDVVGRCRHLGRERHKPMGLTKRPSQLLEMRDPQQ